MTAFTVEPVSGAKPLDADAARRLASTAGAITSAVDDAGVARIEFAAGVDAAAAEGNLQMAARMVLGAHWQTRYRVAPAR